MGLADAGICPSYIVVVRPVIGISYGLIVPPVGSWVYHAIPYGRPDKILVEGAVHVIPVEGVDITHMVTVKPVGVVVDPHASQTEQPSISIGNKHVADSVDPSVIVIEYRNMADLHHCTEIIILYIGVIVKP